MYTIVDRGTNHESCRPLIAVYNQQGELVSWREVMETGLTLDDLADMTVREARGSTLIGVLCSDDQFVVDELEERIEARTDHPVIIVTLGPRAMRNKSDTEIMQAAVNALMK